jgi:hypothetical protein
LQRVRACERGLAVLHRAFLSRVQKLFAGIAHPNFPGIKDGLKSGRCKPPVHPMSDRELARAIRELRGPAVSDGKSRTLSNRFGKK